MRGRAGASMRCFCFLCICVVNGSAAGRDGPQSVCAALSIAVPAKQPRKAKRTSGVLRCAGRCREDPQRGAQRHAAGRDGGTARPGSAALFCFRRARLRGPSAGRSPGALPVHPWGWSSELPPRWLSVAAAQHSGSCLGTGPFATARHPVRAEPNAAPWGSGGDGALPAARDLQPFPLGREDAQPKGERRWVFCSLGSGVWRGLIVLNGEQRDSSPGGWFCSCVGAEFGGRGLRAVRRGAERPAFGEPCWICAAAQCLRTWGGPSPALLLAAPTL